MPQYKNSTEALWSFCIAGGFDWRYTEVVMAFSFFTKQPSDSQTLLIIDIGSASVGAARVAIAPGKAPHILALVREDIPLQEELTSARFSRAMGHALERTLKALHKDGDASVVPSEVYCTLSSPWCLLKTRHIVSHTNEDRVVTEDLINDLVREDASRLKTELSATLPGSDIAVIEQKILEIKLNGYTIKSPFGQKTSHIEVVALSSLSSKKAMDDIETRIRRMTLGAPVHFGAFPVALFSGVRDIFPEQHDFLCLDISGESTEVSLARHDVLAKSVAFPRGRNFFIREISSALEVPHGAALTLFNMHLSDMLDIKRKDIVTRVVQAGSREWSERFGKALTTLAQEGALPRTIYVTVDPDLVLFFTKIIADACRASGRGEFIVRHIDQHVVTNFVSSGGGVPRDSFVIIETLLAHKLNTAQK